MLYIYIYIYILYTPNLEFEIIIPGREREQGRFRGSIEGAGKEHEEARESTMRQCRGAAGGCMRRLSVSA